MSTSLKLGPYDLGVLIGSGSFGEVYQANHRSSNTAVAIKVVDKHMVASLNLSEHIKREIAIMKSLKHPNVVSVRSVITPARAPRLG